MEAGVAFMDVLLSGALPALLNLWKRRHLERRWEDWQMLEFVVFSVRQAVTIYLLHLGSSDAFLLLLPVLVRVYISR